MNNAVTEVGCENLPFLRVIDNEASGRTRDVSALKQFIGQLTDISFKMFGELNNVRFLAFMSNGDVISHEEV